MATLDLTQNNFAQTINSNDLVIVDFWAPWCGPCRAFAPIYEAASEKHPGVVFAKVNTEEEQQLAASFSIRSIPTLLIFREQIILYSEPGSLPGPALDEVIGRVTELDMEIVRKEIADDQAKNA